MLALIVVVLPGHPEVNSALYADVLVCGLSTGLRAKEETEHR